MVVWRYLKEFLERGLIVQDWCGHSVYQEDGGGKGLQPESER